MTAIGQLSWDNLKSRNLFYPCAREDVELPIREFLPYIDNFWFVDTEYSSKSPQLPIAALGLRLVDKSIDVIEGLTLRKATPFKITVHHTRCVQDGRVGSINIYVCCGRGYDVFRRVFVDMGKRVSVFFHRGDSGGEGGSGFLWLRDRLKDVLESLDSGGLIVTDGSLAIRELAQYHRPNSRGVDSARLAEAFVAHSYRFECIGYLGEQYGATLAWKTARIGITHAP